MPIEHIIDHLRKLILARAHGTLTAQDISNYKREIWSRSEVADYDELMDMTHVKHIALESIGRVEQLAHVSASKDNPAAELRFAIVAPEDVAFGLGRMYQGYRAAEERSTKEVGVFRSWEKALAFLGQDDGARPAPPDYAL